MNRPSAGENSAILGGEAGVVDLLALIRGKNGARRHPGARRSILSPISGPMFTNRVEPMNLRRAPRPAPARAAARPEPPRPEIRKPEPPRPEVRQPEPPRAEAR